MSNRTATLADNVAWDAAISDYELWRELKDIELALYNCMRIRLPVPIDLLYRRKIVRLAQMRRGLRTGAI